MWGSQLYANYARNAISSTLSFAEKGMAGYKGMYQAGKFARQTGAARGLTGGALAGYTGQQAMSAGASFLKREGTYGRSAMGAVGAGGAAIAADFLNPWGLGFGD